MEDLKATNTALGAHLPCGSAMLPRRKSSGDPPPPGDLPRAFAAQGCHGRQGLVLAWILRNRNGRQQWRCTGEVAPTMASLPVKNLPWRHCCYSAEGLRAKTSGEGVSGGSPEGLRRVSGGSPDDFRWDIIVEPHGSIHDLTVFFLVCSFMIL